MYHQLIPKKRRQKVRGHPGRWHTLSSASEAVLCCRQQGHQRYHRRPLRPKANVRGGQHHQSRGLQALRVHLSQEMVEPSVHPRSPKRKNETSPHTRYKRYSGDYWEEACLIRSFMHIMPNPKT